MDAFRIIPSPVGPLTLVAGNAGLAAVLWEREARTGLPQAAVQADHPVLAETARQLAAYFAGHLTTFSLPLDLRGTPFQRTVWSALLDIPYGEVRSYGAVARAIGQPGASRAVGAANGRNPVSIVVPCHRVIGSTGRLTGFGGGLAAKERLLSLERATAGFALTPLRS